MTRYPVLDLWVDDCNMEKALDRVREYINRGSKVHTVFASNPEKNYSVPKNPSLYKMFKEADLLIPDGIGMVLAARLLHGAKVSRVPGCELMQNICKLANEKEYRIFIYGAKEEVSKTAVEELMKRYNNINIVGRQNGFLSEDQNDKIIARINESKAQILFLALGSPKQEMWIAENRNHLRYVRVCQCIGGTLDVIADNSKRAPEIYCKLGLEWFYRLISEPKRIKRQIKLPVFALQVFKDKIQNHN